MLKNKTCHILILEDVETDAELIKRAVKSSIQNAVFTIANDKQSFVEKLNWQVPQVILSDYNIPGYGGLEAMKLVHEKHPHIPFVFVTGMLNNEEKAAKTILEGASAYLLKDNLKSLGGVIAEVLEKSKDKYEKVEKDRQRTRRINFTLQKITAVSEKSSANESEKSIIAKLIDDVREDLALKQVAVSA
jgi:CheY-like chemotaxis protein